MGLFRDGPEWKRMRTLLDKQMLRPRSVAAYDTSFNEVTEDFIANVRQIRDRVNDDHRVPNLNRELFNWSLESTYKV